MTSRAAPRGLRLSLLAATALLPACFPSFEVGADGGADGAADRAEAAADCGRPGDSGHEAAVRDARPDAPRCVAVEVVPQPAHGGPACAADGSACGPGDVTTFTSKWVPPQGDGPYAGACSKKQIADAFTSCFGPSQTMSGCATWEGANPACLQCMVTDSTAPRFGPIVLFTSGSSQLTVLNSSGCMALAEPCNEPCAAAAYADVACDLAACTGPSAPCAGTSAAEIQACLGEADGCGCANYHTSETCFLNLVEAPSAHPAVRLCAFETGGAINETNFTAVVSLFCAAPP